MFRFYPTLLLLLTAPLAHAQLSADYYYRAERPEPQVAVPPPDSATAQPARADSTRLLAPNDASATLLPTPAAPNTVTMPLSAYSPTERYQLGRADARQFYKPSKAVFWGTFGATLSTAPYLSLLGRVATVGVVVAVPPSTQHLSAPTPAHLLDSAYHRGYVRQAQLRKLGKASAGFGAATGVLVVVASIVLLALLSRWGC